MKKAILLFITLVFVAVGVYELNASGGGDILYTKPVKSVLFSHKTHERHGCGDCHSGLFEMKALAAQDYPDFNMDALYKGKYCGACHNGRQAFASDTQCARCHGGVKEYLAMKDRPVQKASAQGPSQAITIGSGNTAVGFNHTSHASMSCGDCHTKLFKMKKGTTKITFKDHGTDKYCYACHNGKKAFGPENCSACHSKVPAPRTDLTYKLSGLDPAHFSHDFHGKIFKCEDCHPRHFVMKKGGTKMTMQGMYEGKYCGACHNGNLAFPATDCAKCHKK